MTTLTYYASYDEVRAALGLTSNELEDSTLALNMYYTMLVMELEGISINLPAAYAAAIDALGPVAATTWDTGLTIWDSGSTVWDVATSSGTVTITDAQKRLVDATRIFAVFSVAKSLLPSLPMFAPKDISDGKASIGRFSDKPYEETALRVTNMYGRLRTYLETVYASASATDVVQTSSVFIATGSPTDPVTG